MSIQLLGIGILLGIGSYEDIKKRQVSLWYMLGFTLFGIVLELCLHSYGWKSMAGGVLIGILICVISIFSKGSIGLGDGWMIVNCGMFLGFIDTLWIFFAASVLCAVVAGCLWVIKRVGRKTELPFVPFMFGAYVILLVGKIQ